MARTIQVSDDVYHDLSAEKRSEESFSELIRRIMASRKNPLALLDLPSLDPDFDYEDFDRRMREADEQRSREIWAAYPASPAATARSKG